VTDDTLIYLIEIDAYDDTSSPAVVRTLRYTSGRGYTTAPTETPANAYYEPRLMTQPNFARTAFADARVMGGGTVGVGELLLANADQALSPLLDYGIDGRAVVVRVGPQSAAYPSGFTTFLAGTAEQVEVNARRATIRLRDRLAALGLPLQANKYAGTNSLPSGKEGTAADIKGQPKPLAYGRCYQVPLVCVNTSRLIYQFHDGQAQAVDAVYDRGAALSAGTNRADLAAMEATAPAAGAYDTCLAEGLIRLGATPAGIVTADVRGDATGTYVNTVADIVQRILTSRCGVSGGDIDTAAFSALNTAASYEVGLFVDTEQSRQEAINGLLASVGAWLSPTRAGLWQIARLVAPTGSPAAVYTDQQLVSIERQSTRDDTRGLPVFRVTLGFKPFFQRFSATDIASGVTQAARVELLQSFRTVVSTDAAVQTKHILAPEMERTTLLTSAADAATEAARLLALHGTRRDFVRATVRLDEDSAAVDLGAVVELQTARLGYTAGRLFAVVGVESDGAQRRLTLDLWG
jgi:hypothetical protein